MLKMFVPHEFHRTTGCLLFEDGDNGGITAIVAGIEDLYNTWSSKISKADFWALAANAAIIEATPDDAITDIPFRWGRVDAASCEYDEGRLPDSEQGYNHIMAWAGDQLGFTERETVALMGAHTLGRAEPANSGYDGEWVAGDAIFDNQYFTDMIDIPWVVSVNDFTDLGIGRLTHQWNAAGRMMLNTDMALGFDLGADDPNAISHPPCGGNPDRDRCSRDVPTRSIVEEFSNSNAAWIAEFLSAWVKMQELGVADQLQDLDTDCGTQAASTPSPTPSPTSAPPTSSTPSPTASPTTSPPVTRRRRETMTFEMRFDSVDYNELIDDQDARAIFEAEYVAVVRRGARRAFEDTVSSVLAEDQESLVVRILGIRRGSVVVQTGVIFPARSSGSAGGEAFAAEVESDPTGVFSSSPTLLAYQPSSAAISLSVEEEPDEGFTDTLTPSPTPAPAPTTSPTPAPTAPPPAQPMPGATPAPTIQPASTTAPTSGTTPVPTAQSSSPTPAPATPPASPTPAPTTLPASPTPAPTAMPGSSTPGSTPAPTTAPTPASTPASTPEDSAACLQMSSSIAGTIVWGMAAAAMLLLVQW